MPAHRREQQCQEVFCKTLFGRDCITKLLGIVEWFVCFHCRPRRTTRSVGALERGSGAGQESINLQEFEPQIASAVSPFKEQLGLLRAGWPEVPNFSLSVQPTHDSIW